MSLQSPPFEKGLDLIVVSITGYNRTTTGAWTAGTVYNILAFIDEITHDVEIEFEDIRPIWALQLNEEAIGIGNSLRLTTLRRYDAGNAFSKISNLFNFAQVSYTQGGDAFVGFYRTGRYSAGSRGHGAQRVSLEFRPVDPGQAQVTYTPKA